MSEQMKNNRKVSAIIPTFNGRHLLQRNIVSVFDSLEDKSEIIIVDDASTDDTEQWLKITFGLKVSDELPELVSVPSSYRPKLSKKIFKKILYGKVSSGEKTIRLVALLLQKNQRFAAAANIGVLLASYPLLFILNNDVMPEKNVLSHILPHFLDSEVFGVGCLELSTGGEQAGKNKLWFHKGLFVHAKADSFESGETGWVDGGSGVFDREKWLLLRGMDLRFYPAYWEDIDLSFRARKMGWKVLFEANAIVHHNHETTNADVFGKNNITKISWKNARAFTIKNGSFAQKLQFFFWYAYWIWKQFRHEST